MQGYHHPLYAESFFEIGEPLFLPKSKGWLIKRQIPGTNYFDAMGPYPLFFCEDWEKLPEDLEILKDELVSVSMVFGPFSTLPMEQFEIYFEKIFPYKVHFILDFSLPFEQTISKGRRKDARRALRKINVELLTPPEIPLQEWEELYANLVKRHNIKGIRTFSHESFKKQLAIPGTLYFRAKHDGEVVGGNLYVIQDEVAYFHLSAFSDEGYGSDAAYAVKWVAVNYLKDKVSWMNLGGSTTGFDGQVSGLDQFKKGWSSGTKKSYFCGKILNKNVYHDITQIKENLIQGWFPAYRSGDY